MLDNNYKELIKTNKTFKEIYDIFWQVNESSTDSIVLICRGDRMEDWDGFVKEVSAVLQFPYYFNNGGNSFSECICDLAWIFKKRIFVFFINSNQILCNNNIDYLNFFERSSLEVPPWIKECQNAQRNIYYIFQNIDKEFPLFEDKELSEYK